jgi:hypothetical protein
MAGVNPAPNSHLLGRGKPCPYCVPSIRYFAN